MEWSGRKALSPLSPKALRARQARHRERAKDIGSNLPDGCDFGDDFGAVGLILLAIVLILVLIAIGPILTVIAFAIIEVTIVVIVAGSAIAARTLLGRPWRVMAVNALGENYSWKQVGWSEARDLANRIQAELDAGADPERIAPGGATPLGQGDLVDHNDLGLVGQTWVRVASKLVVVAITIWAAVTVALRYL